MVLNFIILLDSLPTVMVGEPSLSYYLNQSGREEMYSYHSHTENYFLDLKKKFLFLYLCTKIMHVYSWVKVVLQNLNEM